MLYAGSRRNCLSARETLGTRKWVGLLYCFLLLLLFVVVAVVEVVVVVRFLFTSGNLHSENMIVTEKYSVKQYLDT